MAANVSSGQANIINDFYSTINWYYISEFRAYIRKFLLRQKAKGKNTLFSVLLFSIEQFVQQFFRDNIWIYAQFTTNNYFFLLCMQFYNCIFFKKKTSIVTLKHYHKRQIYLKKIMLDIDFDISLHSDDFTIRPLS